MNSLGLLLAIAICAYSVQSATLPRPGSGPCPPKPSRGKYSFPKVELHLHLDGSTRYETLLHLSRQKGIPLSNATTVKQLKKLLVTDTPKSLNAVLAVWAIFMPVITDDLVAIERISYELCEDQAKAGVVYFEARHSPFLMISENGNVTAHQVVEAIARGFRRGKADFGVEARQIVCMIVGLPQYHWQILRLAESTKHLGVVGIDIAGDNPPGNEEFDESVYQVYQEAKRLGIHRTAHAGEMGAAMEVVNALNKMHVERVGHGYHIMDDEDAYLANFIEKRRAHLEACPLSSVMTAAVPLDWSNHPVRRWANDGADFSISRDDPLCFDNTVKDEMKLANKKIGLTIMQLWRAQYNAALASFAEEPLKTKIIAEVWTGKPDNYN